jgi:2,3-bisphosphoglycerate-independent phosphoglycerate mutase
MAASPKVATYDLQPEMSAYELTDSLIPEIEKGTADFICLNFANADMVGHTGIFSAAIKAVETVDACVNRVVTAARNQGYTILVTADHGNADYMINEDGSPNTAHTLNPVPLILVDQHFKGKLRPGKLGDLAPTILYLMELPVPAEMTGNLLIVEEGK